MAVLEPRPEYPGDSERKESPQQDGAIRLSPEQSFEKERMRRAIKELTSIEDVRKAALLLLDDWTLQRGASSWLAGAASTPSPSVAQLLTASNLSRGIEQQQSIEALRTSALDLLNLAFQQRAGIAWLVRAKAGGSAEGFDPAAAAAEIGREATG